MKLVTIHFPEKYLEIIENVVKSGDYPNRSELISNFKPSALCQITYILWDFHGLKKNYIIMGIKLISTNLTESKEGDFL